ncbi:MAG TPA: Ig-like domain-containing protein [Thermoanaerobaculia bacterium]|nr:Ig-like domain-containing protein [Thermoanaerobaculia bacterium]
MSLAALVVLSVLCFTGAAQAAVCAPPNSRPLGPGVLQWRRWEMPLTSQSDYFGTNGKGNPSRDLLLKVTFTQCDVAKSVEYRTRGFWYGLATDGQTLDRRAYRIRGAFPPGTWRWEVTCSKRDTTTDTPDCSQDGGLKANGYFKVTSSPGEGLLYSGGFLSKASTGRYLTLANNSKFFWLGDAAWNANILMSEPDWETYIMDRSSPIESTTNTQFTVVQIATAPKAAGSMDTGRNPPFDPIDSTCSGDGPAKCYRINPRFWKNVDDKIEFANQHGMAVVLAGFIEPLQKELLENSSSVATLPAEAKIFAENMAARLYGNFVIFSPGFDHMLGDNLGIIDLVGSAIGDNATGVTSRHLVTNHAAGGSDPSAYAPVHAKTWLDFDLFQSGTPTKRTSACSRSTLESNELCNLTDRAASMAVALWKAVPKKPVINGESVYPGQDLSGSIFAANHTPYRARQAAYLSMLSGAMGYSMGTCGVLDWNLRNGLAGCSLGWTWTHPGAVLTAGTMKVLRLNLQSVFWERLTSEPSRIQNQTSLPEMKMAVAYDGSSAVLAYLTQDNTAIRINFNQPRPVPGLASADQWPTKTWSAAWLSPRSLTMRAAPPSLVTSGTGQRVLGVFEFTKPACELASCDANDWVLKIVKKGKLQPLLSTGITLEVTNGPGFASPGLRVLAETSSSSSGAVLSQAEIGGDGTSNPGPPQIATELAGNSMVVWQADNDETTTISGRVLDSQGQPLTPEFIIASGEGASPGHPSVAALANGDFLVVWAGSDANRYGPWIRAQTFDRWGAPLTPPRIVAHCEFVAGDFPQVVSWGTGGYAIAWEMSEESGIYVLQVDAAGSASDARLAQGSGATPILESLDESGSSVVVSYGLYADDGTVVGGDTLNVTTAPRSCPPIPLAANDAFSTDRDSPVTIGTQEMLSNDAPGVRFDHADPSKCVLSPDAGSCTYTPSPGFVGTDSFTYMVRDAVNNSGTATVTITVAVPLVANPDQLSTTVGVPILVASSQLLQNDSPGAVFVRAENPVNGTLDLVDTPASGSVYRFTPAAGFAGVASFEYLISRDGNPPYARGTVTIIVTDAPPQALFTVSCVNRTCIVRTTSRDDIGITRYLWNWGDGTPVVEPTTPYPWADQWHTYAQSGRYTITHTVVDTSDQTGTLALDALANTPPVAANDSGTTERDIAVLISILANDSDADGDALTLASVTLQNPGASYQAVQSGGGWAIRITPPDTFVGTLTFTYVATDRWGATATATVTLNVTQWTSVTDVLGEQLYCAQNGSLRIPLSNLLSNDYDSDGDPLSIVAMDTSILMGTLDCASDPTACTYRPPTNAYGYTLFRYTASDPAGHRDTATVRLYVGTHGNPPTASDDYFTTPRDTPRTFTIQDVVQNDHDPDGDTLTVGLISGSRDYGSLTCSTPMYRCTYTPNAGFVGTERFSYTASDVMNPQATAAINILTLPPPAPTFDAREDVAVTGLNQQIYISNGALTSNDFDPEHDPVAVSSIDKAGLLGTLTCDTFGCTYKPPFSFQGITRFKYTATDGHGGSDMAIVRLRVGGSNHPPVAVPDSLSTPKNTPLRFSVFELLRNDYDPDDDPLNVTVYETTAHKGTLSCGTPNYWCTYTPNVNATGTDTVTYAVSDGSAVTSTFTLNILP